MCVEVRDFGRGIPKDKQWTLRSSEGVGLVGMRAPAAIGGNLQIYPGENGTVVTATLPILIRIRPLACPNITDHGIRGLAIETAS